MFNVFYIYRVPIEKEADFLRVQGASAKIYIEQGALDDETWGPVDLDAKYGTLSFLDTIEVQSDERLYIGVARYRDKLHHENVMAKVDVDERIIGLFNEMSQIIKIEQVIYGEFSRVI